MFPLSRHISVLSSNMLWVIKWNLKNKTKQKNEIRVCFFVFFFISNTDIINIYRVLKSKTKNETGNIWSPDKHGEPRMYVVLSFHRTHLVPLVLMLPRDWSKRTPRTASQSEWTVGRSGTQNIRCFSVAWNSTTTSDIYLKINWTCAGNMCNHVIAGVGTNSSSSPWTGK